MNHLTHSGWNRLSVSSDSDSGREGGGRGLEQSMSWVFQSIAELARCDDSCLPLT